MDGIFNMEKLIIIEKIKGLPLLYLKELIDFIDYLQTKREKRETLYLSEKTLAKEWLLSEEESAWKDL